MRGEQEVAGGRDVYLRAAARRGDRQGGHQPAALPVGAGQAARAAEAGRARSTPDAAGAAAREAAARRCREGQGKQAEILGERPRGRAGAWSSVLRELGVA